MCLLLLHDPVEIEAAKKTMARGLRMMFIIVGLFRTVSDYRVSKKSGSSFSTDAKIAKLGTRSRGLSAAKKKGRFWIETIKLYHIRRDFP
jgi:hypothetical protein